VTEIRIVAVNAVDPMCQYLVVSKDAPEFKTRQEALRWLDGKVVAAPKGSCPDRRCATAPERRSQRSSDASRETPSAIRSGVS